jgi:CheY-like chemotaxis protein
MSSVDEQRWLHAAINDLNNILQVADESITLLEPISGDHPDAKKYFHFLRTSIDRAVAVTQQLAQRVQGQSIAGKVKAAPAAPQGNEIEIANAGSSGELIMIIDDEPLVTTLVREMLSHAGYRVVSALEPFRALEIYRAIGGEIDLVMLDFTLPIMDGSEVFAELQQIRPDVAVMLSSGFTEQTILRAMLARGLRGFLPKPFTEQKLLSQVRSTLDAIRSERTGERRIL